MSTSSHPHGQPPRRSFLKWVVNGMGALAAAVLGVPAALYLIDARNRPARTSEFKTVARLSDLEVNVPKAFDITETRSDAWTLHPNEPIGRVWLIRRKDDKVDAFTSVCPHLGCSINYEAKVTLFICPCHNGTFDLEGKKRELPGMKNPAPRGMDALQVEIVPDPAKPDDSLVQVKYEKFAQG